MALKIIRTPVALYTGALLRTSNGSFIRDPSCTDFHEPYREGHSRYVREDERPLVQKIRDGVFSLKEHIELWKGEVKERFQNDPKVFMHGDTDIVWTFHDKEELKKWISTSDKDNNDGFSECEFVMSKSGKGLFRGTLSTRIPEDGVVNRTGYCNISAMKVKYPKNVDNTIHICQKAFSRHGYYDWTPFTHLVMRVRGDGRSYMMNLVSPGIFDVTWHDMYSFVLYTRGGPYWQQVKLPFSRFMLNSKGAIQDKQARPRLHMISNVGITCSDSIPGNFQLEIDYIGVHKDMNFNEEFAYEKYKYGKSLLW